MNFLPIGSTASANVADVWLAQAINSYSMIIIIYYKALALVAGSGCWLWLLALVAGSSMYL